MGKNVKLVWVKMVRYSILTEPNLKIDFLVIKINFWNSVLTYTYMLNRIRRCISGSVGPPQLLMKQ